MDGAMPSLAGGKSPELPDSVSNGAMICALLVAILTIVLDMYLLNFLKQVRNRCYNVPDTPRVIAEIILWVQLIGAIVACIVTIYMMIKCGKDNSSEFCQKMLAK